mmetsp:Transcript_58900/g.164550  ORF Transcript_58900/g.164550 Transcript_58900/m.164550 type:complete len:404 (+) Transcript_58900:112-1323(+)
MLQGPGRAYDGPAATAERRRSGGPRFHNSRVLSQRRAASEDEKHFLAKDFQCAVRRDTGSKLRGESAAERPRGQVSQGNDRKQAALELVHVQGHAGDELHPPAYLARPQILVGVDDFPHLVRLARARTEVRGDIINEAPMHRLHACELEVYAEKNNGVDQRHCEVQVDCSRRKRRSVDPVDPDPHGDAMSSCTQQDCHQKRAQGWRKLITKPAHLVLGCGVLQHHGLPTVAGASRRQHVTEPLHTVPGFQAASDDWDEGADESRPREDHTEARDRCEVVIALHAVAPMAHVVQPHRPRGCLQHQEREADPNKGPGLFTQSLLSSFMSRVDAFADAEAVGTPCLEQSVHGEHIDHHEKNSLEGADHDARMSMPVSPILGPAQRGVHRHRCEVEPAEELDAEPCL